MNYKDIDDPEFDPKEAFIECMDETRDLIYASQIYERIRPDYQKITDIIQPMARRCRYYIAIWIAAEWLKTRPIGDNGYYITDKGREILNKAVRGRNNLIRRQE